MKPEWLNTRTVRATLSGQSNGSAPVRNHIGWLPLKILAEVNCEGLEEAIWEEFKRLVDTDTGVAVIPKLRKMDRLSGKSWRCISLINTTSK